MCLPARSKEKVFLMNFLEKNIRNLDPPSAWGYRCVYTSHFYGVTRSIVAVSKHIQECERYVSISTYPWSDSLVY